jgi:cyclopropane-fatty-acyl-phospholipid synthase
MNQKQIAVGTRSDFGIDSIDRRGKSFVRGLLIRILKKATQGHFILRENGRIIAEIGSSADSLHAEVDILDQRTYWRALFGGNTGAGEAFIAGWWTTPDITQVTRFFARNLDMMDQWGKRFGWLLKPASLLRKLARANTYKQAKKNILAHYDLGNEFYQTFLDERMQYSAALYQNGNETLAEAQRAKLTRICEQLELGPDDHVLEVGSGWGGLAIFAAQNYGCKVTTTTISDAQLSLARSRVREAGLEDQVKVLDMDYRLLDGQYDKIVSVEMIEAVGERFLSDYFRKLNSLLKPGGLLLIQAITIADQRLASYRKSEDFIQKHIFPGGFLPSLELMLTHFARETEMVVRDVHDMGIDYARTLADWRTNFLASLPQLKALGCDDRFCNLWLYYLGYCEGGFLERRISTVQLLSSKAPHYRAR